MEILPVLGNTDNLCNSIGSNGQIQHLMGKCLVNYVCANPYILHAIIVRLEDVDVVVKHGDI